MRIDMEYGYETAMEDRRFEVYIGQQFRKVSNSIK